MPGPNRLTAVVWRHTDGTYLEDQDMWFLSGIVRPVYLLAEPPVSMADLWVRTELDHSYRDGTIRVEVQVANAGASPVHAQVDLLLRSPGSDDRVPAGSKAVRVPRRSSRVVGLVIAVPDALTWTAETPHLYEVTAVLRHPEPGDTIQVATVRTGIRVVEIRDRQFLVNGVPIRFFGVNRHDVDPDHAWAVPEARRREDLLIAKRLNVNAIRCAHYPNPQHLYDQCDELGLYVIDECDLETHGIRRRNVPGDNPTWTAAVVDRMQRMVAADRNHPIIVMWSLGNEAGLGGDGGGNFARMRAVADAMDGTRPYHYEGDHQPGVSDVISRMYATAEELATQGINVSVVHVATIKPFDAETVLREIDTDRAVFTLENHTVVGGLFEAVAGELARRGLGKKINPIALPDEFIDAGALPTLHDRYGLSTQAVVDRVTRELRG